MKDALLVLSFLLIGICGYWILDQVDRFLNEHVKGDEEEEDAPKQG